MLRAALVAAGVLLAVPAFAACAKHDEVSDGLARNLGQVPTSLGISEDGRAVIEVFSNSETLTWSVVVTRTDGMSCVIGSGGFWQAVPPPHRRGNAS